MATSSRRSSCRACRRTTGCGGRSRCEAEPVRVDLLTHQAVPSLRAAGGADLGGRLHREGDVAGALVDPGGPALGAGAPPLHGGALVDHRDETTRASPAGRSLWTRRWPRSALQHLQDRLGGGLRRELQRGAGLLHREAADEVHDPAGLHRRDPHEAGLAKVRGRRPAASCGGRWCAGALRCSSAASLSGRPSRARGTCGSGRTRPACGRPSRRSRRPDVLAAVVHRDGVTDHGRHDHRTARPGLDDVVAALLVLRVPPS